MVIFSPGHDHEGLVKTMSSGRCKGAPMGNATKATHVRTDGSVMYAVIASGFFLGLDGWMGDGREVGMKLRAGWLSGCSCT